jgi:hypothetical protein
MPVPEEFQPFFTSLVDKSRRSEINWEAIGQSDAYRVTFSDFSISISQDGDKPVVRIQLFNDHGGPTATITVDDGDDEWLGAVGLINSAERKVRKLGQTLQRAMEELGREGPIGLKPPAS